MSQWNSIAERSIEGTPPTREEALEILRCPKGELLDLLQAAYRVRKHHHGKTVKLHILLNAMSGMCPEDCTFCSQSIVAKGEIERYRLMTKEEIVSAAKKAKENKAWKFCIVTSTRGPNEKQLDVICDAVREIKETVGIRICTSLGIVTEDQAVQLKEAGVDRFNHNLETSPDHYESICTTHTYQDRVQTVEKVRAAGMEACSGGILGMGESHEDIVELAFATRKLGVESIPVNFLNPRPGTPLEDLNLPEPDLCLKTLCLLRFVNPDKDIRAAGGRELALRSMQPFVLYPCNSMFTDGYLTTDGNKPNEDHQMIEDMGFEVVVES